MSTYHIRDGETIVRIEHGDKGYYMARPDIKTDEDIIAANKFNGVTYTQCKAAKTCSMFDTWDKFDEMVETFK